jgi:hypothetical protein
LTYLKRLRASWSRPRERVEEGRGSQRTEALEAARAEEMRRVVEEYANDPLMSSIAASDKVSPTR